MYTDSIQISIKHTKDRRLLVGTYVMVRLVKQQPEFLRDHIDERLFVRVVNQSIVENAEILVNPQPGHGWLGVVEVLVGTK